MDVIVPGAVREYPFENTELKICIKNAPDCSFNET